MTLTAKLFLAALGSLGAVLAVVALAQDAALPTHFV